MEGYTDTIVLECSRTSSAEGRTHNDKNPAEYTNELGDGVVLDIGDTIELHSAYISETGAQEGSIEIKNRVTGDLMDVEVTQYDRTVNASQIPTGYEWEICSASLVQIRINDKATNVVISPYKTTNGEFTMCLPRRYCYNETLTNANWNYFGQTNAPYTNNLGNSQNTLHELQLGITVHDHPRQFCSADYEIVYENGSTVTARSKGQVKNNNERFTIFRAEEIFFNSAGAETFGQNGSLSGLSSPSAVADPGVTQNHEGNRDPSMLLTYIQVKDLVTLEAKEGFNSPDDVAFDLTQQLNARTNFRNKTFRLTTGGNTEDVNYTSYTETPCYKTYNCGTPDKLSASGYYHFRNVNDLTWWNSVEKAHDYLSAFQHIGVKRPDLYIEGRRLNASEGLLIPDGTDVPAGAECMNTGIEWSLANISRFDKLFEIEAKYPELFDNVQNNYGCSPTLNRFLHINLLDKGFIGPEVGHRPHDMFGYDLQEVSAAWGNPAGPVNASSATYPLFFDFNPDTINLGPDDVSGTPSVMGGSQDYSQLAHGWARKMYTTTGPKIAIQFAQLGNNIPLYLVQNGGFTHLAQSNKGGRQWGWDHHYSAYGCPVIGLWNGFSNSEGISNDSLAKAKYFMSSAAGADHENLPKWISEIYLGADKPLVSYDSTANRFSISQLHQAEVQGNVGEAGRVGGTLIPVNPNSGQECYKINKKLLRNNFTPDMAPYNSLTMASAGGIPESEEFSQNLTPWTPYDAMGGIFIEEFAIPQFEWNTNLMGVMGYRYDQFNHAPFNASGRQTRIIDYQKVSKVQYPTTNAKVNEGDIRNFNMNATNNNLYNNNLPVSWTQTLHERNIIPAIDVVPGPNQSLSTKITAQDLPTKSLRPYYTIRSDIIGKNNFIGEASGVPNRFRGNSGTIDVSYGAGNSITTKPIIGVVDKVNGYGDYYTEQTGQLTFTNTEPRVISSIKTSIHDPDGTYADCGLKSSVLYKINKKRNVDLNPLATLLESKKKADQKMAEKAEGIEPKPNFKFLDSENNLHESK